MNKLKVIVSGANGQDGSYMCEYLLKNTDYDVLGGVRRTSQAILSNLQECLKNPRFKLVPLELTDAHSIITLIKNEKPDYFIHLGASSFVADSWNQPAFTIEANSISLVHILESIRNYVPNCRLYSAGSSEQWGDVKYSPQDEKHSMSPRSIYGVSKCCAAHICKVYRESYNLYVVHGILTNHESPRRQIHFISRKITNGVARIYHSIKNNKEFEPIFCGNIYAKRDWSHSKDFVDGIWKMLNQELWRDNGEIAKKINFGFCGDYTSLDARKWLSKQIKEYVLSSNETYTVKDLINVAFNKANIYGRWEGEKLEERYIDNLSSKTLVAIDSKFYRPADVESLLGCSDLARKELIWNPKYTFDMLISEMVENDIKIYESLYP
jgi:GDPmannose 4,6-dehydratase